ncbi:MAG: hypothetical protein AAFY28_22885, partial [Actinomycetota bacterium]
MPNNGSQPAKLALEDGTVFAGRSIGADGEVDGEVDGGGLILAAALASSPIDPDAIDHAILQSVPTDAVLSDYDVVHFTPFDPVGKRTEAEVRHKDRS